MIYEVAAAVEHIVSLVQQVERHHPVAPEALAAFASTLKDSLETRCQKCWHTAEPENGSAHRSVAWHLHPAGEGADPDLLRAFASVIQAHAREGEVIHPHNLKVVQLALDWLPFAFTLWIDPGCVAIRTGSGPGAAPRSSSYDFDLLKSGSSALSIHVIWGQMVAQAAERDAPQLTVSSAALPRPVPIVKPTPTVAHSRYPVNLFRNLAAQRHSRSPSTASSASSSCQGLVRSASLSSTHTVSTDATSLSGLEPDAQSDSCPSLAGSPASSLPSTHCTPNTEHDRESLHDTTIGGDATQRFAGIRLFDDDQQDDEAGDATIDASPMLGLSVSKNAASPQALGASFAPVKPAASSTPIKCNYTTHDNGNVGVLGGGVRLGGSSKSNAAQPPRHRQHSTSKSVSHIQASHQNQLLPAYMPRPMQRQFHHLMNAANYSTPMPTVPLPAAPLHQHFQAGYPQHQLQYQQHQQYPAPQPRRAMAPFAHPAQLPTPYGFPLQQQPHQPHQPHQPYNQYVSQQPMQPMPVHLDATTPVDGDDETDASTRRRRLRSRGRRSRGRGAGRAARRQAAALRALELASTDELPEFDDFSRCSTPATSSEYTDSIASSVYSSAASSPAKGGKLQRASRGDLRATAAKMDEFGAQLHANLARLQAAAAV
ncbi:uncharacterized protein SPSC_01475 [Sporisorium scitamineum]|uniref:Anti-proliferative protein domain-containing protein n=1 Tax=Sporisorium scitamineum TaxID=49012 RepID=A0A0F7RWF2_9BASI|nr:hypothetical protein [Sporisorium scitamineum]CDU22845.1 uncharacterized protein SPSC_01475 [Sporisorium scitamineum]